MVFYIFVNFEMIKSGKKIDQRADIHDAEKDGSADSPRGSRAGDLAYPLNNPVKNLAFSVDPRHFQVEAGAGPRRGLRAGIEKGEYRLRLLAQVGQGAVFAEAEKQKAVVGKARRTENGRIHLPLFVGRTQYSRPSFRPVDHFSQRLPIHRRSFFA
jgi:hypothetical protein